MSNTQLSVSNIYSGSDPAASRKLCLTLEKKSHLGKIASELYRSQKASARAKVYRGGNYRDLAYERKGACLRKLCEILSLDSCGLVWGWGKDKDGYLDDVLYIDLPQGQVSFHSSERFKGPKYQFSWDCQHESEDRIVAFIESVLLDTYRAE